MKKTPTFILLFILLAIHSADGRADDAGAPRNIVRSGAGPVMLRHWYFANDPAPNDSLPVVQDSQWTTFGNFKKNATGNWLLKAEILLQTPEDAGIVWGVFPKNYISAYDIYLDGSRIARNGVRGTDRNDEKPGSYNYSAPIPVQRTTPGMHTFVIRLSNYHDDSAWKWYYGGIVLAPYGSELGRIYQSRFLAFFMIGILCIPFLFNLFLYVARNRRIEHLLFSMICLTVIMDFMTEQITAFIDLPTTYIHLTMYIYPFLTMVNSMLFPAFFIMMFSLPKKTLIAACCIDLIVYGVFVGPLNIFSVMAPCVLIILTGITTWALAARREGSVLIGAGLLVSWAAYALNYGFLGLVTIMVLCTSILIALQFAQKEKAENEARLLSMRLENELLKKNINPHFLLNSLTSIIVWLRKEPDAAIALIEALADEFKMITQISNLKLIPVRQEIDLCRTHLKIMNYRKGAEFTLITNDIADDEMVPPMLFHTLVENGLTHGYENKYGGTFTIRRESTPGTVAYFVSNDGSFDESDGNISDGMGFQYIKARLEESFPGRWNISSCTRDHAWEVVISIENR